MNHMPDTPKPIARLKRQRLELTDAEERTIRVAMLPYNYRSLHQFVRDVILFLADAPENLVVIMNAMARWKESKGMEDER